MIYGCSLTSSMPEKQAFIVNVFAHIIVSILLPYVVLVVLSFSIVWKLHCGKRMSGNAEERSRVNRRVTVSFAGFQSWASEVFFSSGGSCGIFQGVGKRIFSGRARVAKFHFTNLKLRKKKRFSTEKLIGKYQVSKLQGWPNLPTHFRRSLSKYWTKKCFSCWELCLSG